MTSNLRIHGIINANHAFTALIEEGGRGGEVSKTFKRQFKEFPKRKHFFARLA